MPLADTEEWQCNGCKGWLDELARTDAEQRLAHEKLMHRMKDPVMREAAKEISAVLRKYDLMGAVVLTNRGDFCEYVTELSPKWSCITREDTPQGQNIRIKAKCASDSTEAEKLRVSVSGLMGLNDVMRHVQDFLGKLIASLGTKMEISHFTRKLPNDESQN